MRRPHAPGRAAQRRRSRPGAGRGGGLPGRRPGGGIVAGRGHDRGASGQRRRGPAEDLALAALALARRFAAGATMWCVAPQWPAHARHVAVEFVHPVIVGKRALCRPSASTPPGPPNRCACWRGPATSSSSSSTAGDPVASDLLARADAWGLTSLWLGAGRRPGAGGGGPRADHVVWLQTPSPHWRRDRAPRAALPPPVGADPCRLRASRAAHARGRVHRRGLHHLLGRGPGRRGPRRAGGGTDRGAGPAVGSRRSTAASSTTCGPGDLVLVHAGVAVTSPQWSRTGD